jgi:hypothetical protein
MTTDSFEFCPRCAERNPQGAERCSACGTRMDAVLGSSRNRPLLWKWIGIYAGGMALLLALVQNVPLINLLFLPLDVPETEHDAIVVHGGLYTMATVLLLFVIGGVVVGALARRSILRELAVGGLLVTLAQWGLWIAKANGNVKVLFTAPLVFWNGSSMMYMPPALGLISTSLLGLLLAVAAARAGQALYERMTRKAACDACGEEHDLPAPKACPNCGEPIRERGGVDWRWAAPGVALTLVLFFVVVRLLGPTLSFYWPCTVADPTAACKAGIAAYNATAGETEMYYWRDAAAIVVLHPWKYLLFTAPLFALAPLVITARAQRSRNRTVGVVILLSWLGATAVALFGLGFAQFESVVVLSLRLHLIAGVPWCLAGAIGMMVGRKLARPVSLEQEFGLA